jgi:hypothetical protein
MITARAFAGAMAVVLLNAMYKPCLLVAAAIIISVDVFPAPADQR